MLVAMYAPNGTHAVTFLDNYTNIFVRDVLLRVKGVGDVISRADDFSMRIWLKPDKLAQLGLTATDITNALQEQNIQISQVQLVLRRKILIRHLNIPLLPTAGFNSRPVQQYYCSIKPDKMAPLFI